MSWRSRGDILRWWRTDVVRLPQRELAAQLGVGRTAVTNWERGTRMASLDVSRIDDALGADGVLSGLLWAFGTPEGLDPRHVWSSCFPGPSTPVWMWVRSPSPSVRIEAEWGMYRMEHEFELGPDGAFVTAGVSIEESPVVVDLSTPGWVDFGRGELPIEALDVPVVDAMELVQRGSAYGDFTDMLTSNVAERFERSRPREMADLGDDVLAPVETFIHDRATARSPSAWPRHREGLEALDRRSFARLREARHLSLTETAQRLTELTDAVASRDTLRRFEAGTCEPHDPLLPVALDHVLGGSGHLAVVRVAEGQGDGTVRFPGYWQAPVWIAFEGSGEGSVAELQWSDWKRVVHGRLPFTVLCDAAMIPLRIAAPPTVRWTAGVGRRHGAFPINHAWVPASMDTTYQALSHYQDVFVDAVRHVETTKSRRERRNRQ